MLYNLLYEIKDGVNSLWDILVKGPIIFFIILGVTLGVFAPDVASKKLEMMLTHPLYFFNESPLLFIEYAAVVGFFLALEIAVVFLGVCSAREGRSGRSMDTGKSSCCTADSSSGKPGSKPASNHGDI